MMTVESCAISMREPCQVRKEAAVSVLGMCCGVAQPERTRFFQNNFYFLFSNHTYIHRSFGIFSLPATPSVYLRQDLVPDKNKNLKAPSEDTLHALPLQSFEKQVYPIEKQIKHLPFFKTSCKIDKPSA